MDALYSIFQSTLSPDPNTRVRAELDLRATEAQPGMLPGVLQIVASEQADGTIRQAAAIYLKNRLRKSWDDEGNNASSSKGPAAVPQQDREPIKSLLLPTLVSTTGQVQVHVASAFHTLVRADFPSKWPDLMDNVGRLVKSQTPKEVYGGIRALLEIVRAFRWIDDANLMEPIVASTFPTILATGTQLLQSPDVDSQDVGALIYIILKVYKSSINSQMTSHHQSNESIIPWGKFLLDVAQRPVSSASLPSDEDDREICPWYKAKKWACFSLNKLFSRYGNPSQLPSTLQSYKPFAERFVATFAPEILSAYLRLTESSIKGEVWLSKKQTHLILRFYEECVKPKSTWSLLKPHVNTLVQQFVFPRLCTRQADEELWELDPVEFVRFNIDPIDIGGPETSASSFLTVVASKRTKTAFLPQLEFVTSVVQAYPASRSAAEKAGALAMCKAMDLTMLHHPKVSTSLEGFFSQYVVPELTSQDRVLRFRACQLISAFGSKMAWRNSANLQAAFMGVMQCVTDEELPVRVEAAAASTVLSEHDEIHAAMAPNAPRLMQELLKLSDELELDLLTEAKSKVVERFSEELMPFSVELVEQMKNSYVRLVETYMASADIAEDGTHEFNINDGEGDRLFAAISALQTIYSVLTSCDEKPEILAQLEGSVLPLVAFTIEKEAIELYDDCFDLLDVLTFYQKKVSPGMWGIFELMAKSFLDGAGIDYLAEMLSTFDNLVSYGTDVFKSNENYRKLLLGIYEKAMKSDQLGLGDHLSACRLADVVLLLLKGSIDEYVPMIVSTVLPLLDESKAQGATANLRKWACIVILDALVYDAGLTLRCLESSGATQHFFTLALGQVVPKLVKVHEKKVVALALMSVLGLDEGQAPQAIKAGETQLLTSLLDNLAGIPEAIKRQRALEDAFVDDEDEDAEEEDIDGGADDIASQVINDGDDDADVHDEDNEYLELLAREGARLRAKAAAAAGASAGTGGDEYADVSYDADSDEEADEDEDEEGVVYESPLDDVPVFDHFRQLMTHLQNTRPNVLAGLGAEGSSRVTEVGSIMDERVRREEGDESQASIQ
ncbi:ARM repeat-containing protein [Jaminaea rosea]|uniref:ARM repeat-containing protein n=1 Tax=Jaminaea rosea TaxID=1569628 RepID=A0A316URK3_9BASI|nr:ARM repeat-containing protein [Jaminaea rosea]PWN26503.1 ARM repeat-containing protein [Jaminaea rosea]